MVDGAVRAPLADRRQGEQDRGEVEGAATRAAVSRGYFGAPRFNPGDGFVLRLPPRVSDMRDALFPCPMEGVYQLIRFDRQLGDFRRVCVCLRR